MLGFLPGMSLKDAAKREVGQLNDRRTGTEDYNWQDHIGGFLGGYTQEQVEKEAEKLANKKLKEQYDIQYAQGNVADKLGVLTGNYQGVQGRTLAEIEAAQASDIQRGNALESYVGTKGATPGTLSPTISSAGIQGATTRLINDELTRIEEKGDRKIERQDTYDNRRQDFKESQAQRQTAYNNRVLDMKDAREARNARDKQLMMIIQGLNSFGQGFQ
jgi:hypothetical protein